MKYEHEEENKVGEEAYFIPYFEGENGWTGAKTRDKFE